MSSRGMHAMSPSVAIQPSIENLMQVLLDARQLESAELDTKGVWSVRRAKNGPCITLHDDAKALVFVIDRLLDHHIETTGEQFEFPL